MNIALWVIQVLLAVFFGMTGFAKVFKSKEELRAKAMPWVEDFDANIVKAIGITQILAAIGLILPILLDIFPLLTPLAAIGLILTMIGAAFTHFRRNEYFQISINTVLLLLSAFVAYGRIDLLIAS